MLYHIIMHNINSSNERDGIKKARRQDRDDIVYVMHYNGSILKLTLLACEMFPPHKPYIVTKHELAPFVCSYDSFYKQMTGNPKVLPSVKASCLLSRDCIV